MWIWFFRLSSFILNVKYYTTAGIKKKYYEIMFKYLDTIHSLSEHELIYAAHIRYFVLAFVMTIRVASYNQKIRGSIQIADFGTWIRPLLGIPPPSTTYPGIIRHHPSLSVFVRLYPSLSVIIRLYPSLSVIIRHICHYPLLPMATTGDTDFIFMFHGWLEKGLKKSICNILVYLSLCNS